MKKRLLAALLALTMVCALLPATALASDSDFVIDEDGVLTKYNGPGGDVVIPDGVTRIGERAFEDCRSLTSITIPEGVTSIDERGTFCGCISLTLVTIPNSLTSLNADSFFGCISLIEFSVAPDNAQYIAQDGVLFNKDKTELVVYPTGRSGAYTIPEGVTRIGDHAFEDCIDLTGVTIPNSVTDIGDCAFAECAGLTGVTLPDSVTSIGDYAFSYCSGLTSMTIPAGVTTIGNSAFGSCTSLTSVTIPNSVTTIGNSAFYYCPSLTSMIIPASVTSMGQNVFHRCEGLTDVTLSEGLSVMGKGMFNGCTGLTAVTIPASVTSIGTDVFSDCINLTDICVDAGNTQYASLDGVLFTKDMTELVAYPIGKGGVYAIPDGVTGIWERAFSGCAGLTGVTIPEGVVVIGEYAFYSCSGLTSVDIPAGVTSIKLGAFWHCTGLTSVTIPDSVTSFGALIFKDCPSLTIYGYTGSQGERYCAKEKISFIAMKSPSGTARKGSLESDSGESLSWSITTAGVVAVTGDLAPEEKILVGCYDSDGQFLDVKCLNAQNGTAQIDPTTPNIKIFWLGTEIKPLSPSLTVWEE